MAPKGTSMLGIARTTHSGVLADYEMTLIRQAEAIMEEDPPMLPVAWERLNYIWYNYVKGLNPSAYFGIFDTVRLDTVWLDKA